MHTRKIWLTRHDESEFNERKILDVHSYSATLLTAVSSPRGRASS